MTTVKDSEDTVDPDLNQNTDPAAHTYQATTNNPPEMTTNPDDPNPTNGYTDQTAFTPDPFIHPVSPTYQSSHQQWIRASRRWTDGSNNPSPFSSF